MFICILPSDLRELSLFKISEKSAQSGSPEHSMEGLLEMDSGSDPQREPKVAPILSLQKARFVHVLHFLLFRFDNFHWIRLLAATLKRSFLLVCHFCPICRSVLVLTHVEICQLRRSISCYAGLKFLSASFSSSPFSVVALKRFTLSAMFQILFFKRNNIARQSSRVRKMKVRVPLVAYF